MLCLWRPCILISTFCFVVFRYQQKVSWQRFRGYSSFLQEIPRSIYFYGTIPKIILHFRRNPNLRKGQKTRRRSVELINLLLSIAGRKFPQYVEKHLDFSLYFKFFCIHWQVFTQILKIIYRTLGKSDGDRGFWHSEDCASWYILIIKANEMH